MTAFFRRGALAGAGVAAVLASAAMLVSCHSFSGAGPKLSVSDPYVPVPAVPGGMGAGYLTVGNQGAGVDHLVKVTSPDAESVTMHRSIGGSMDEVSSFDVPAHGKLELARDGDHLMLMGWRKPPAVGDRVELDLVFAKSGTIVVRVPVEPLTYRPGG